MATYKYTFVVTIDHTQVPGDVSDFPLQIAQTNGIFGDFALGEGGLSESLGLDIIFAADPCGVTPYKFERLFWAASGDVEFWIKIPTISSTQDTKFYILIGLAGDTDHQDKHATWDSNYKLVAHFGGGMVLDLHDSTVNANDGTDVGGVVTTSGLIGNTQTTGIDLDGTRWVDYGNASTLHITDAITVELWYCTGILPGFWTPYLYGKATPHSTFNVEDGYICGPIGGSGSPFVKVGKAGVNLVVGDNNAPQGRFNHIVWTYSKATAAAKLYINGVLVDTQTWGTAGTKAFNDPSASLILGHIDPGIDSRSNYIGVVDEFRVSAEERTLDYIQLCYINQIKGSALYDIDFNTSLQPLPPGTITQLDLVVRAVYNSGTPGVNVCPSGNWAWRTGTGPTATDQQNIPWPCATFPDTKFTVTLTGSRLQAAINYDPSLSTFSLPDSVNPIFPSFAYGVALIGSLPADSHGVGNELDVTDIYIKVKYASGVIVFLRPKSYHITNAGNESQGKIIVGSPSSFSILSWHSSGVSANQSIGIYDFKNDVINPGNLCVPIMKPDCLGIPPGVLGKVYTGKINVTGGAPPITFAVFAGTLPPGLTLNTANGAITGTPTKVGTYSVTFSLTDANGTIVKITCVIKITTGTLLVDCSQLPPGVKGVFYNATIIITGGSPPYTITIVNGTLPPGLTLDPHTGVISGIPTVSGKFCFNITVMDSGS